MKEKPRYFVYMLRLAGGSLYTGYTRDLTARFRRHQQGTASRCTRSFRPVQLAGCWEVAGGRSSAMSVEAFIKGCSRRSKDLLLADPRQLAGRYEEHTGRAALVAPCPTDVPPAAP